ncbi:MAG: hypothetical protein ACK41P_01920 [Asticcacaulis sp.]
MRLLNGSAIILCLLATPTFCMAQSQGGLGSTSTGSQDISLTLTQSTSNQVRITGLNNINFGTFPANYSQSLSGTDSLVCFYHNSPTFKLTVTRTSNPEKGKGFKLVSSAGSELPIHLSIQTGGQSFDSASNISDDVVKTGVTGNNGSETCSTGVTGSIVYSIGSSSGKIPPNTPVGNYSATFQITLAAE